MDILRIYVIFFIAGYIFETFLELLNRREVLKNKSVPVYFKSYISEERYEKSVKYTLKEIDFTLVSDLLSSVFLLCFILAGGFGFFENLVLPLKLPLHAGGILIVLMIFCLFSLLSLPFSLYFHFVVEKGFGFNTMTLRLFFTDFIKELIISSVMISLVMLSLFFLTERAGELWWIFAFAAVISFQILAMMIYPVFIAPLFNKFLPLEEGELKERLLSLAERLSFRIDGIFSMDGSRRSKHSNAYFTGLGRFRKIVLFDTLISALDPDEIEAVLAHEIGHSKLDHIAKRLTVSAVVMFFVFFIASKLIDFAPLFTAFGFAAPSCYGIVLIFSLCSSPFTFFLRPVLSLWSRRYEYAADRYAVNAVQDGESMKNALIKLSRENLSNLTPNKLYSFYHYSHPALYERLSAIDRIVPFSKRGKRE